MRDKLGRFMKGHVTSQEEIKKIRKSLGTGANHPSWKGGIIFRDGYKCIYCPDHPYALNNYVREHRLIAEKALGRYFKKGERVHHINMNRRDNRDSNLLICDNKYHMWLHSEYARAFARQLNGEEKNGSKQNN